MKTTNKIPCGDNCILFPLCKSMCIRKSVYSESLKTLLIYKLVDRCELYRDFFKNNESSEIMIKTTDLFEADFYADEYNPM